LSSEAGDGEVRWVGDKCRAAVTDILRKAGAKLPKAVRDKLEYKLVEIVRATQEIYDS